MTHLGLCLIARVFLDQRGNKMKAAGTNCLWEQYQKVHWLKISAWSLVNMLFFKEPCGFSLIGLIIQNIPIDWHVSYLSQDWKQTSGKTCYQFSEHSGTPATNGWTGTGEGKKEGRAVALQYKLARTGGRRSNWKQGCGIWHKATSGIHSVALRTRSMYSIRLESTCTADNTG